MGGSPSIPAPPNPYDVANAQQGLNTQTMEEQQASSNVDIFNPLSSTQYEQTGVGPGGVPTYSAIQQLSPQEQEMLGFLQRGQLGAGEAGAGLMTDASRMYGSGLPNFMEGANNMTTEMMGHETSYLSPFFGQQTSQLDTQLRNQGIMPGTPAYDQQMNNLRQNQGQTVSGYLAQIEPQTFAQAVQQYEIPGQEAGQLLGIGAPQLPGQVNPPQASGQPANLVGAVANSEQAAMQAYQAQVAQQSSMMQGLGGLGSAAILAMALA